VLRVTGDRVEDDVHVPEVLFEVDDAAVENVVGTSLRDERAISSGGGRRHLGANEAGQLYRKDAHAPAPPCTSPRSPARSLARSSNPRPAVRAPMGTEAGSTCISRRGFAATLSSAVS
jgi:hypothetical protein